MADSSHSENEKSDYSIRIVLSVLHYLREMHGEESLDRVLGQTGISRKQYESERTWLSLEQVVQVLQAVRDIAGSDELLQKACIHGLANSYGPLRFVLRATSPRRLYEMGQKYFPTISTVGSGSFEALGKNKFLLRYFSKNPESRLMCLGRQAQCEFMPTIWGLPKAKLHERSCIAHGDECCEYEVTTFQPRGLLRPVLGGVLGAGAAVAVALAGPVAIPAGTLWFALPALGFLVGHLIELRRNNRVNLAVAEEMNEELRRALGDNAEAQREIIDLHQRQKDWNRRLEQQVAERARINEEVAERLGSIVTERNSTLRGVSHDLNNPLTVVYTANRSLEERGDLLDPEGQFILREQRQAVDRMRTMIAELIRLVSTDPKEMKLRPEIVEVAALEDSYRRRLRALVGDDRGIRVSVLPVTREAPPTIVVDRMVLDRIVDNLMSNAAKYTERGSIVLELDGKPGFLTIKISDTGRGIATEDIDRVFRPGGSDPVRRAAESHGLGLSVVVRLLDRIGGKLEVMSLPGRGSTFWAHFPVAQAAAAPADEPAEAPEGDLTSRVVTIRRAS